jgi:adenylylsulfate kinase
MEETRKRSIAKAVSWRVAGSIATTSIVFLFTGNVVLSLGVGATEAIAKILCYYVHERLWEYIPWWRVTHPLAILPISKELAAQDIQIIRQRLEDLGYL